jgi:hypothetical protein
MKKFQHPALTREQFAGMIEDQLQRIMEHADAEQYSSLLQNYERIGDADFDNYLAKEKARLLQDEGFKKYDRWKRNGVPTLKTLTFLIAHEIEEEATETVDWRAKWLNSSWKESEMVRDFAQGMDLEGKLFAINDFRNRVFNLTFESWKNGEWPISEQPMVGKYRYYYGNQYRVCTLSMDEYEKIVEAQKTILQKLVDLFLKGQTDDFNHRFANSGKKEELLETEKKKVGEWLSNKDLSGAYNFPNPNGGTYIETDLGGLFREEGQDKNLFPKWYDRILVQGNEAHVYIKPEHESARILIPAAAVLVLDKYMTFLENRQNVNEALPDFIKAKDSAKKGLPALEDILKEPGKLPILWKRLSEMDKPFVNENGQILGGRESRKQREIMALAQTISGWCKSGYGQFDLYSILCERVGLNEGPRNERIVRRLGYDDIRLEIFAEIKDLLK